MKADLDTGYEQALLGRLDEDLLFFDFIFRMEFLVPVGALLVGPICADCTLSGGDLEEPEFWDE